MSAIRGRMEKEAPKPVPSSCQSSIGYFHIVSASMRTKRMRLPAWRENRPPFYSPPPDGERAIRSPPRSSAILPLARIMPAGLPGLAAPPAIRLRVLKTPKIPVGYLAISFISPLPVWRYIINAGFNIFAATASMRGRARLQSSTL